MDDGQGLECIYLQYLHDHLVSVFNLISKLHEACVVDFLLSLCLECLSQ